jgi:hypothetical protein
MESCSEGAQGHVELGGEDEQEERGLKLHVAVKQTEADFDGDDGGADGGEHFQRERGEEGDAQNAEGCVAVFFADFCNGLGLPLRLTEEFERGQSLQAVEEVGAEKAQGFILAFGDRLCTFADDDHEKGNQRGGDEEDQAS